MKTLLETALAQYGTTEIKGVKHNPDIVNYFEEIGYPYIDDDETPWCSAFMCWCAQKAGYPHPASLVARRWLTIGSPVYCVPLLGDIVVLWRESKSSWKGHVGIYVNQQKDKINILGGNQYPGQVNIRSYSKKYLLGYRKLHRI